MANMQQNSRSYTVTFDVYTFFIRSTVYFWKISYCKLQACVAYQITY